MIFGAHTLHTNIIINLSVVAGSASVRGGIVVLIVGTDGAVLSIIIWINGRAVFALLIENVIDLLIGTELTFQISEVPILRMLALNTLFQIPE